MDFIAKQIPYVLLWNKMPVDISFIFENEKPAGKHGFLQVKGENFVFEDGTPAKGAILDGRDIGTVVCPDAEIKLFLIASAEIRAKRRLKELQEKGIYAIYEDVLADVKKRDERDSNRAVAPLKPADDAFILDTSDLTVDSVFEQVIDFIKSKQKTVGTNQQAND